MRFGLLLGLHMAFEETIIRELLLLCTAIRRMRSRAMNGQSPRADKEACTSRYIEFSMERAKEAQKLKNNVENFRKVSEGLIL
jgi:hypothetical protein